MSELGSGVKSNDGRLLKLSNIDMSCGIAAEHLVSGELYDSHECYADGILCYVDKGLFGDVVIQPIE